MQCDEKVDVLVLGAGWSGLYAARHALAEGLSVKILERRDELGGVWAFSEDRSVVTVMESTISSSSRVVTEASDFPMPKSMGHFMSHDDVKKYLAEYAEAFDILPRIAFGTSVERVEREDDWVVSIEDGWRYRSRFLAVCTGLHQRKRPIPEETENFELPVIHAGDIKRVRDLDLSADDHVVVYGGGETASDVVDELVKTPCKVTWAIRGGYHFFRKSPHEQSARPGHFERHHRALDLQSTALHNALTDFPNGKPGMRWQCNLAGTGSALVYQGHGIAAWANDVPWFRAAFNKNGHATEYVRTGRVSAQGAIVGTEADSVCFEGGDVVKATRIICCVGYEPDWQFLPESLTRVPSHLFYKLVFHPDEPSLAFFGLARPIITSIPFMTELQCRWAMRVFAGRLALPDAETRHRVAEADAAVRARRFFRSSNKHLVSPGRYARELMHLMGERIFSAAHFRRAPWRTIKTTTVPLSPFLLGLGDESDAARHERLDDYVLPYNKDLTLDGKERSIPRFYLRMLVRIGLTRALKFDTLVDAVAVRRLRT